MKSEAALRASMKLKSIEYKQELNAILAIVVVTCCHQKSGVRSTETVGTRRKAIEIGEKD
jgi:hypothetical protein